MTPIRLQRKRAVLADKRRRSEANKQAESEYKKLLASRLKEQRDKRHALHVKRRLSSKSQSEA